MFHSRSLFFCFAFIFLPLYAPAIHILQITNLIIVSYQIVPSCRDGPKSISAVAMFRNQALGQSISSDYDFETLGKFLTHQSRCSPV